MLPKTEEELKELCVEFVSFSCAAPTMQGRYSDYDDFIKERNKPTLHDGLTKEQWDIVIKDKLLCEFLDEVDDDNLTDYVSYIDYEKVSMFDAKHNGCNWKHCRIHHSQPQFNTGKKPDWLDD